jgi:hypothetical protein
VRRRTSAGMASAPPAVETNAQRRQALCPSGAEARLSRGGEVEAGSELTTILPALTLPEAIKARPIPHVAGRTSRRTA